MSFTILNWRTKFLRCYHKSWHYNYYFTSIKFLSLYISRVIYCWPFTIVWYEVLFLTRYLLVFNNECPICWLCDFELIRNISNIVFIFCFDLVSWMREIPIYHFKYKWFWKLGKEDGMLCYKDEVFFWIGGKSI